MPDLKIQVPHSLTPQEAVNRIKGLISDVKKQFGDRVTDLKEEWTDQKGRFSFKAMGFDIAGSVEVLEKEVKIEGKLPFAASMFKGRIESTIRERARELLS